MAEFFHGRAERCELMACVSEGLAAARSRGSRGSRRGGGSGNRVTAPLAAAEPLAAADPRAVLEAVASNVQLQREHVIQRELIEAGVASTADARLRQKMSETFAAMLQGTGPSFSVLQGAPGAAPPPLAPLASLLVEGGEHIVLPEAAWAPHEGLLSCLTDIATGALAAPELPPLPSDDTLLPEMSQPMEQAQLQATFSVLQGAASAPHMGSVIRMLVQLAQLDGPLRMLGGQPSPCDLQTFQQHLSALANQLNTLHDPNFLGKELQSPVFARAKYELFALQHVQMLVWLQRVQQGLQQGAGKTTPAEVQQFVVQISHAARVLLFQPMLLHSVQVMSYVQSLPPYDAKTEAQPGSMRASMAYPPESATEQDRVEWLLLNLLLQFQTVYKDALCNPGIYTPTYSPGEASLFQGFFRLEEIYTHLIQRFPGVVVMSEQEMQVVTQLCQKINRHFTDGKTIRQCLETNPGSHGKQMLVQSLQLREIPSADYAVREWILPFMMTFTDLLKVLWTLWTQHAKRGAAEAEVRASCEGIARLVGERIVAQLADEELALRAAAASAPKDAAVGGGRRGGGELPSALPTATRAVSLPPLNDGLGGGLLAGLGVAAPPPAAPPVAAPAAATNGQLDGGGVGWASVVRRAPAEPPPAHPPPSRHRNAEGGSTKRTGAGAGGGATDDSTVRALVAKREQARFSRDFDAADRLREQLAKLGVTLDDQAKTWRAADGRSGSITQVNVSEIHAQKAAKSGAASLDDAEINRLVREREQARYTSDYKTADRLRDQLERHGVSLDVKEAKWLAADGRWGQIPPVNISAAHAQKAARAGAPRLSEDEVQRILVQREQARARRDYKTADVLRDQLEKHGVYLDSKENKWQGPDGASGAIVVSQLSDDDVGKILAQRQAARLRHDYKAADRLRDTLNEQCVSVDDKKNRWDASDGRSGTIEPFTCMHGTPSRGGGGKGGADGAAGADDAGDGGGGGKTGRKGANAVATAAAAAAAAAKGEGGKRVLPEKARRELAKHLRAVTSQSARQCEKALQANGDDIERAADWLISQAEAASKGSPAAAPEEAP